MRVHSDDSEPPMWPVHLLAKLGEYVYSTDVPLGPGHRVDAGAAITGGTPPSRLTALAFTVDPRFGEIETPNGALTFLTACGITAAELERMKATSTAAVVGGLLRVNPDLVTEPPR